MIIFLEGPNSIWQKYLLYIFMFRAVFSEKSLFDFTKGSTLIHIKRCILCVNKKLCVNGIWQLGTSMNLPLSYIWFIYITLQCWTHFSPPPIFNLSSSAKTFHTLIFDKFPHFDEQFHALRGALKLNLSKNLVICPN